MRPAFRRGWEGEGKPNRRPGAGQRARSDRHTGAAILLWEREGKALGVPTQSDETEAAASLSRNAAKERRPRNGATRPAAWRRAERATRPLRQRRSAADRSERETAARPARREARAPAGQPENAAPLRAPSAGKSASLDPPAHLLAATIPFTPAIVTGRPRRWRRLGGAIRTDGLRNRAWCGLARRRTSLKHQSPTGA